MRIGASFVVRNPHAKRESARPVIAQCGLEVYYVSVDIRIR